MKAIATLLPKHMMNYDDVLVFLRSIPEITTFLQEHRIPPETLQAGIPALLEYARYRGFCFICQKQACSHIASLQNMDAQLTYTDGVIAFDLIPRGMQSVHMQTKQLITQRYVSLHYLTARFSDWDEEAFRQNTALQKALHLAATIPQNAKGLYIYGRHGVGKTHLIGALAYTFFERSLKTALVFWPEVIREIKYDMKRAESLIYDLKMVAILMIDDLGGEVQTSAMRDEVLLPILNHRMNHKKMTFFTSNFSFNDLEHHFTYTQYGEKEKVKAARMLERIRTLAEEVHMPGKNRRHVEGE